MSSGLVAFVSQPWRKSEGEGLVPIIACRDVLTCRVDLYAHAPVLTCPHTNCMQVATCALPVLRQLAISISSYSFNLVWKADMEMRYLTVSFDCQQERTVPECLMADYMP